MQLVLLLTILVGIAAIFYIVRLFYLGKPIIGILLGIAYGGVAYFLVFVLFFTSWAPTYYYDLNSPWDKAVLQQFHLNTSAGLKVKEVSWSKDNYSVKITGNISLTDSINNCLNKDFYNVPKILEDKKNLGLTSFELKDYVIGNVGDKTIWSYSLKGTGEKVTLVLSQDRNDSDTLVNYFNGRKEGFENRLQLIKEALLHH